MTNEFGNITFYIIEEMFVNDENDKILKMHYILLETSRYYSHFTPYCVSKIISIDKTYYTRI